MSFNVKGSYISEEEFQLLIDLIHSEFGLRTKGDKRLTFHARISHRLHILGLTSYREYVDYLRSDPSREELLILASLITNNETYFFREHAQLEVFKEILKTIKKEKQKNQHTTVQLLSFPCSSGEEAYTLNIVVQESGHFFGDWEIKVIGIDVDRAVLQKARDACYTGNSFRVNCPSDTMNKYFTTNKGRYTLKRSFAKNVEFRYGNIIDNATLKGLNDMDVIFCRNLLIYMSDAALHRAVQNLYNALSERGYLFIGTAETIMHKTDLFKPELVNNIIVYRKNVKN